MWDNSGLGLSVAAGVEALALGGWLVLECPLIDLFHQISTNFFFVTFGFSKFPG